MTKVKKRRGRKGTKCQAAFDAVTTTPVELNAFLQQQGVSVNVMHQSKRFDKHDNVGKVRMYHDKQTNKRMIVRK